MDQNTLRFLSALLGGLVAVGVGVFDLETGSKLTTVFDGGLVTGGVALIVGHQWFPGGS